MTDKELNFSDEAKEAFPYLIQDMVHLLNGLPLNNEETAINLLQELLAIRKQYALGRPGLAGPRKGDRFFTLLKGGR